VPFTWSGKINLWGPTGWLSSNRQYTVCRYHDYDNDTVDTNIEHPAVYSDVNSSITDQNFLIINNNRTCADETFGVGSPTNVTVYYNTQQYQP
jgi:hypothetical protein